MNSITGRKKNSWEGAPSKRSGGQKQLNMFADRKAADTRGIQENAHETVQD